jgi:uncharacterized protein (TIGR02246 family)
MRTAFCLVAILFAACASADDLSGADREAIVRVYDSYVSAWLKGDAEGVMKLFADDAVLIPHHGLAPVVGARDIRKWWWPPNAPTTTIDVFKVTHDQIGGSGRMAFIRGRQVLEWTTNGKKSSNRGNHLTLLRKTADGNWRITHQMWGDPPNQ